MASGAYNSFKKALFDRTINLTGDTIRVALLTSAYTPNFDHDFFDDVNAHEASGTGYTAGGVALSSRNITQDNTNDRAIFDAADASWPAATITARYGVIYKSTGTAATSPLIALIDFGENKTSTAGTFTIAFDTDGVLTIT